VTNELTIIASSNLYFAFIDTKNKIKKRYPVIYNKSAGDGYGSISKNPP
jgi:hypothetical protein